MCQRPGFTTALTITGDEMATLTDKQPAPSPARRSGFTLTEVLISVALVLVIILGINQIFSIASRAVGGGQGLSELTRIGRVAQATFSEDLSHIEIDRAPFLIIRGQTIPAFRDKADQLRDRNFVASPTPTLANADTWVRSYDPSNDGNEILFPRALLIGPRNHRTDQLIFFTRSPVRRQTGEFSGAATSYIDDLTSTEAYVCYGHLKQPDNSQLPPAVQNVSSREGRPPGIYPTGTTTIGTTPLVPSNNANNFYATQWVLGRNVMVLRDPKRSTAGGPYEVRDSFNNIVKFAGRGAGANTAVPFTINSRLVVADETTGSPDELVQFSLCDVAGTSMQRFRDVLMSQFAYPNSPSATTGTARYNPLWYQSLVFRYAGFPTPTRPLTAEGVARTVPCFVPHCTQFIVEYAGDFLSQDSNSTSATYGKIVNFADGNGGGTDGEIDFTVVNGVRQIRWYGYPRDTGQPPNAANPNIDPTKPDGHIFFPPAVNEANVPDVIPLWATIQNATVPNASAAYIKQYGFPFERGYGPAGAGYTFTNTITAIQSVTPVTNNDYATESLPFKAEYWCVWGPDTANFPRPKMLRITMVVDDPLNRTPARSFEYVFKLP